MSYKLTFLEQKNASTKNWRSMKIIQSGKLKSYENTNVINCLAARWCLNMTSVSVL